MELRAAAVSYEQWSKFLRTYNEIYIQELSENQYFFQQLTTKMTEVVAGINDQIDEDSLPPYEILDAILQLYVEKNKSLLDIVNSGYPKDTVEQIIKLVHDLGYLNSNIAEISISLDIEKIVSSFNVTRFEITHRILKKK